MYKSGFKAFAYSFSVSLFAIVTASKFFAPQNINTYTPLHIENKNISLFLKNIKPLKHPVKKITLSNIPDIEKEVVDKEIINREVVLADKLEDFDFPIEFDIQKDENTQEIVLAEAEVLYSPEQPLPEIKINSDVIYSADTPEDKPSFLKAPALPKHDNVQIAAEEHIAKQHPSEAEQIALANARNAEQGVIPLTVDKKQLATTKVKIGNTDDLSHVALSNANIPIESVSSGAKSNTLPQESKEWKQLDDNPWLVAKSSGSKNLFATKELANNDSQEIGKVLNTPKQTDGVDIASETVKNLIIPIPEKIMQEDNLVPKLAYPSLSEDAVKEMSIKKETELKEKIAEKEQALLSPIEDDDISLDAPVEKTKNETNEGDKGKIIGKLSSLFKKDSTQDEEKISPKQKALAKAAARKSLKKRAAKSKQVSIMPTEIRLSFQTGKAEISGQTLRWVQAFAAKAAATPEMTLEVRINGTSSTALQQKRLNLLYNILTNKGVEYSKINTVFTAREPNSFILRSIIQNNNTGEAHQKNINQQSHQHIQW